MAPIGFSFPTIDAQSSPIFEISRGYPGKTEAILPGMGRVVPVEFDHKALEQIVKNSSMTWTKEVTAYDSAIAEI